MCIVYKLYWVCTEYCIGDRTPLWLALLISGTIYPSTSLLYLRCLSSNHASRLISSPFPIPVHDQVQCLRSDTCHFGHFGQFFFMNVWEDSDEYVTYLLTHKPVYRSYIWSFMNWCKLDVLEQGSVYIMQGGSINLNISYHNVIIMCKCPCLSQQVAELIKADPKEIIFTSGATESNNISVKGVARFYKDKKKHIITTQTVRGSWIYIWTSAWQRDVSRQEHCQHWVLWGSLEGQWHLPCKKYCHINYCKTLNCGCP